MLDDMQWVSHTEASGLDRFLVARLRQSEFRVVLRAEFAPTPDFTVQYFGQPFLCAGSYSRFKRITNPRAAILGDRFADLGPDEITLVREENRYNVSETSSGEWDYGFDRPDFNLREFRSNLVVRWEYSPGSTLFLVWSQDRSSEETAGVMALRNEVEELFRGPYRNVFLVKLSYWLSKGL
jgi:hypothetical protein